MPVSRREFVAATAGAAAIPFVGLARGATRTLPATPSRTTPPGSKLGVGFIGCGKRAAELIHPFLNRADVQLVAVCDVDTKRREHFKKVVNDKYANTDCATHIDHRELLARKDIDAVVITTPDHWHAAQIIDSAKARKDIYCEKPLTLTLAEAKACIDAVRRNDRVFQTGSQQRTEYDGKFRTACEYVQSGRLGTMLSVHVGVGDPPEACNLPEEPMEEGLDWDRWLGPAPMRPYNSILSPRGMHNHYPMWRLYWEYAGGLLADMGAHHFDIAQWGLAMDHSGPIEVHPPKDEDAITGVRFVYDNGVEMFHGGPSGTTFIGSKGLIAVDRDRLQSVPDSILKEPLKDTDIHLPRAADHITDWIDCIKSRKRCICDIEIGARSAAICQLANLVYKYGRMLRWVPSTWQFAGDAEANSWRDYDRRAGYELPKL